MKLAMQISDEVNSCIQPDAKDRKRDIIFLHSKRGKECIAADIKNQNYKT